LDSAVRNILDFLLRFRLGRILGLFLFFAGLFQYHSYKKQILGQWSYSFVLVISITALVLLLLLLRLPRTYFIDLSGFCWGLAYFLSAMDSSENAVRVTDLNFFGSVLPAASLLEWLTLVILFVAAARVIPTLDDRWSGLGMFVGTILLLALAGEGYYRIKIAIAPEMEGLPTYSKELWERRYARLNHEGFRDIEHSLSKDPGKSRLLLVGDSFGSGWGIRRLQDRIGEQVAAGLATTTGKSWESIGASKPGADTIDEIGYLTHMVDYHPDVIVLIYVFNDIDYLIPPINSARQLRNFSLRVLWHNSYLFQELFTRFRMIYYRFRRPGPALPSAVSQEITDFEFAAYNNPELMARHLSDLARFVEIGRQNGATVLVVPFDFSFSVQQRALLRYQDFVRQTQARGIPVCSLEHTWDGIPYRNLALSSTDGHPNEFADRLASGVITKCLLAPPFH
jgi:hypothetical protein